MNLTEWSESNLTYGRKLLDSAVEGARQGESTFLNDESLGVHLEKAARSAMVPATVGVCLGLLAGYSNHRCSKGRMLLFGLLGGVIGFGIGAIWENRQLTASVAAGAWKSVNKTRDEHWFAKNPIDYA